MDYVNTIPTGTVTFLFTDIEGSTKLWQQFPQEMPAAHARHHEILRQTIEAHHGHIFQIIGDAFCAAFATARIALDASIATQRALFAETWGKTGALRVRMGLHTGTAEWRDGDYHGYLTMARVQRIMSLAHGGQILMSNAAAELLQGQFTQALHLRDMGEHALKGLAGHEHVWQVIADGLPDDLMPLASREAIPNNLPLQLTSFVGRIQELHDVQEMLTRSRLATLTGVGGTGKTRLALQAAAAQLSEFRDGVWFVEFAQVTDPALVPQAIATLWNLREQNGRTLSEALVEYLRARHLLLVLDNCEHLLDACAEIADTLLRGAPHLRLLATSREALGIAGESTYPVRSLLQPDPKHADADTLTHFDAAQLFVERARTMLPDFTITPQNASAIAQICTRLDGIPLAIELAAARVKGLSVEQIAERLDDRFRLLTGGSRTALPRQRTLLAAIDWSYKLLTAQERKLVQRLAVFTGGWTIEAAEFVCSDTDRNDNAPDHISNRQVLDLLLRLVDKSLVNRNANASEPRYFMLETIRQFTQEKLDESGEASALRDKHLQYYLSLAQRAEPHLKSARQIEWLERLDGELDNIYAALRWSQENDRAATGIQLATRLQMLWIYRAYLMQTVQITETLLEIVGDTDAELRARGLQLAGLLHMFLGTYNKGYRLAVEAENFYLQHAADLPADLGYVKNLLLYCQPSLLRQPAELAARYQENLVWFDKGGDVWGKAHTIYNIGQSWRAAGEYAAAQDAITTSRALFQQCGDEFRVTHQEETFAYLAFERGEFEQARIMLERVHAFYQRVRYNIQTDVTLYMLGVMAMRDHDYERAREWYSECLLFDQQIGTYAQLAECLIGYAGIEFAHHVYPSAARLLGAAHTETERRLIPLERADAMEKQRLEQALRAQLGNKAFQSEWEFGCKMTQAQAVELAIQYI